MPTKSCSKCLIIKETDQFHKNKFGVDGLHSQCKNCKNKYKQQYNLVSKDKRRVYRKNRKHIGLWRSILKMSLWRMKSKKFGKTIDLLGYSSEEFKIHIEQQFTIGMSWDNHGEWHVDHIIDVSNFPIDTHPSIVNNLSNLRPLWSTTRIIDGVTYEGNLNRNKHRVKSNLST